MIRTRKYGSACQILKLNSPICAPRLRIAYTIRTINVITAAGSATRILVRNLSFISTPCVLVAAMVVSEIKERLSPNIAPPTTTPTQSGSRRFPFSDTLHAIGARTEIVPTLVPIAMEIRQAITNSPGTAKRPGMILSSRFAVLEAPPASPAMPLNAPARIKMNSMVTILSSPIPFAQM